MIELNTFKKILEEMKGVAMCDYCHNIQKLKNDANIKKLRILSFRSLFYLSKAGFFSACILIYDEIY